MLHETVPIADAVEAPADCLKARQRVRRWQVLQKEARFGEQGEA